jgi:hypothetical protein
MVCRVSWWKWPKHKQPFERNVFATGLAVSNRFKLQNIWKSRREWVGHILVCLQHPPSLNIFLVCGFNCASFSFIFHHNEDFAGPKQISGMSLAQVIIRIRPSRNLVLFRFCHSSLVVSSSFFCTFLMIWMDCSHRLEDDLPMFSLFERWFWCGVHFLSIFIHTYGIHI